MEWIREIDVKFDGASKMEVHTITDCFGAVQKVQLSVLTDSDPDGKLQAEKDAMTQRAKDYANKLCARGINPTSQMKWIGEVTVDDCPNCGK